MNDPTLEAVDFDPFAGEALVATGPSTEAQRELWTATRLGDDASCAFNECVSLTFEGALDLEALTAALDDLVLRHQALRSTFTADGASFVVAERVTTTPKVLDFATVSDKDAALSSAKTAEVETAFDLEKGPLTRFVLARIHDNHHVLIITAHHIVCDGWSMAVMLNDLAALYTARRKGTGGPAKALRFSDYATAQASYERSGDYAADVSFWTSQFAGEPAPLELPVDRPRPAIKTFASRRIDYVLDAELVESIKRLGAKQSTSFFTTLLAGFGALLHRLTHQDDIVIAIPSAGQSATGMRELVGHCVNALPLRFSVARNDSGSAFLSRVRGVMLDAVEHQRLTFGSLIRKLGVTRDPSRLPLVSVLFNVDQAVDGSKLGFAGVVTTFASNPRHFENFEIFINAVEHRGVVTLECQYNTDLFDDATMRRWLEAYERLLRDWVQKPECTIGTLDIGATIERDATVAAIPSDEAHTLVFAQADKTPDAIAVTQGAAKLSYRALADKVLKLAGVLEKAGVGDGTLVGIHLSRTPEMVVAVLAVLEAGGAYVPLDPAFPAERLQFMVADSKAPVVITESALAQTFATSGAQQILVDQLSEVPARARNLRQRNDALAYVLYTSGSTGKPKGVEVPHRALVNFLTTMAKTPGIAATDTLLAVTTLSFDIAGLELFLPLTTGAQIVLATKDQAIDGHELARLITAHGVTMMQATPSTWRLLLQSGWQGRPNFVALCGGEALPPQLGRDLASRVNTLWNMYGPTETTIWSTCGRVTANTPKITLGAPIANTYLYVLDASMAPVLPGIVGELYIAGAGVARGYLNRPELTAERFVTVNGERAYRTGDLVRRHADRSIEFVGRADTQVKLRGYRIELGEIESALRTHPDVVDAVAIVREDRANDARLVAYLVTRKDIPPEALRNYLGRTLPEYMKPQTFVRLDAFPLTPNNKVDRKRLPAPADASGLATSTYVEPRTDRERDVAVIFGDVLGMSKIGVHDNFFHLGGHSLLAAHVVSRLARDHQLSVPMRRIFEAPTVAQLAASIDTAKTSTVVAASIPHDERQDLAPLTAMQQRVWFAEQLDPGTAVYNLPSAFRISGRFDVQAMQRSLQALVDRHSTLRTTLAWTGGAPMQRIAPSWTLDVPFTDMSSLADEERERRLLAELQAAADTPIDTTTLPLVRAAIYKLRNDEHVLFWMPHHAIWDGWSFDIFLDELDRVYTAFSRGEPLPLAPLSITYADFAHWQIERLRGPELTQQAEYWKKVLAAPLPTLELATDHARPANFSFAGATEPFILSRDEVDALSQLARRHDATLYMVLLAGYATLLYRLTCGNDVVVGTPVRGRGLPEIDGLLGFFVNTLALRLKIDGERSFAELLKDTRAVVLDAFGNQEVPFDALVKDLGLSRDNSRTPVYQSFFTFQDVRNRGAAFGGSPYDQIHVHAKVSPTDIAFWVKQRDDGIVGGVDYATSLFTQATMQRFLDELRALLHSAVQKPATSLNRLGIVPANEAKQMATWNATHEDYPRNEEAHRLVFAQADKTPNAIAVSQGEVKLTYRELTDKALVLAGILEAAGVSDGTLVGLHLSRTPEMIVAVLAVLEAGGAYVPLDPAFPAERLQFMLADSKAAVVVTERALSTTFAQAGAKQVLVDQLSPAAPRARRTQQRTDALAYVLYTSGSTGKPKGVEVPHRALVNFLATMAKKPGIVSTDTLLAVTTLSFDIAGLELFLPLTVGAQVVLATKDQAGDGRELAKLITTHDVTIMQATPSTWRLLLQSGWQGTSRFKALCGGEALSPELGRELAGKVGALWNMYGPTETTIWSTCAQVFPSTERISIGKPIGNTTCLVLDPRREHVPIGVVGELYIGGDGVARGYLNRPELTADRFVDIDGVYAYRTGDLVRWESTGELTYVRRNDTQVKVRGYRIELGEIESALRTDPVVQDAVVSVREDHPGDVRLVAYVIHKRGGHATDSELRKHLRVTLPDYMVPQHFVQIDTYPLTPNGKVDRKRLPAPFAIAAEEAHSFTAPVSPSEKLVAHAYSEVLNGVRVGLHDNFFELGGHSLLCLTVIACLEKDTGKRLSPRVILRDSLQQVAAQLDAMSIDAITEPPKADTQKRGLLGKLFGR